MAASDWREEEGWRHLIGQRRKEERSMFPILPKRRLHISKVVVQKAISKVCYKSAPEFAENFRLFSWSKLLFLIFQSLLELTTGIIFCSLLQDANVISTFKKRQFSITTFLQEWNDLTTP
jgi:hypothetical protein